MSRILLLVFLYDAVGYFFIFKYTQSNIKETVASDIQLHRSASVSKTFAFHKNDQKEIQWLEEEEEMLYNGKRYDVAEKLETADSIMYYCIADEHEDELYSWLDDHISNHVGLPEHSSSSKKMESYPFKLYFSTEHFISFQQSSTSFLSIASSLIIYDPIYIELNAPPPRNADQC